jgi:hypothetical protein
MRYTPDFAWSNEVFGTLYQKNFKICKPIAGAKADRFKKVNRA